MIRLTIEDGDAGKLDLVLGQACQLLGQSGEALAEGLVMAATLMLRRDGGYFHPIPDDNWTSASYEAVLTVDPQLTREFSDEVTGRIWRALAAVLSHHGRDDVLSLVIEPTAPQVPAIAADWRALAAQAVARLPATRRGASGRREAIPARTGSCPPAAPRLSRLPGPQGPSARLPPAQHVRRAPAARCQAP